MKIFTVPNFITLGNLAFGVIGIWLVFSSRLEYAAYCIVIAAVLDFLDGFVARLFKSFSEIGKQLDSLADMVSFGVLPSFILYSLLDTALPKECYSCLAPNWMVLFALLPSLFAALRLAKFNVDTRQSYGFLGLPTPAHGLTVASFVFSISMNSAYSDFMASPLFIITYCVAVSIIMIAEIPLLSLKVAGKPSKLQILLILVSLALLAWLQLAAIAFVILFYVALSLFSHQSLKQ